MFLASIIFIHVGLRMLEMSTMGMAQIRKSINEKYYGSQNSKVPNMDGCRLHVTHRFVFAKEL